MYFEERGLLMKKGLLLGVITASTAIACSAGFILGSKGVRFEAAKADPVYATITFDKDHHATNFSGGYTDREKAEYNASSSNGGFSSVWFQHIWHADTAPTHDKAPENAFYSFTSTRTDDYCFLRLEIAGLSHISWNISYTGLDDENKGSLSIGGRGQSWDFQSTIHSSGLYNNEENSLDCSIASPYHLELYIDNLPVGATVTINSFTATYDVSACKTARGL